MSNTSRSSFVASFIRHRRTQSQPQAQTFSIDPTSSTSSFDRDARRVQTDERSDNVGAALGNIRAILEASASALDLAPIPGLSAAASALASFIGVIEQTRENDDVRDKLLGNIASLRDIVIGTLEQTTTPGISVLENNLPKSSHGLQPSPELSKRVHALLKELETIGATVKKLSQGSFLRRMWTNRSMTGRLRDLNDAVEQARKNFMMQSELVKEIYTRGIYELQAYDHRQRNRSKDQETLQRLPYTESAGYRHTVHVEKSRFLSGTRKELFRDIETWLAGSTDERRSSFFVLMGEAGTGKSTVAYEIAKRLDKKRLLAGSFFFARDVPALNNAQSFFTTIASQLARYHESFFIRVVDGAYTFLEQGVHQQMEYQLEQLISNPLDGLRIEQPPIIVVDAVDECAENELGYASQGAEMLRLLFRAVREHSLPFRVILTTRPDFGILEIFENLDFGEVGGMHQLHKSDAVHADIALYLQERFKDISFKNQILEERPNVINELTHRAEGLFIYAATIISLLRNCGPPSNALRILVALLSDETQYNPPHLSRLDKLYLTVMRTAFADIQDVDGRVMIQPILGLIPTLRDRLPLKHVASLIELPLQDIRFILQHIRSVVSLGSEEDPVIIPLHASFPQFLADDTRCIDQEYFVHSSEHHNRLAIACFRLLVDEEILHRNICDLEDPMLHKSQIPDLTGRLARAIPPHVLYACLHWADHLIRGQPYNDALILFDTFCSTRLLVWLEVMSYTANPDGAFFKLFDGVVRRSAWSSNGAQVEMPVISPSYLALTSASGLAVYVDGLDNAALQLQNARRWYRSTVVSASQPSKAIPILPLLYDTYNLLLEFRPAIEVCPNHIYISVLQMIPNSQLSYVYRRIYSDGLITRMLSPSSDSWKPQTQRYINHALGAKNITFAKFSNDGSKLVCFSSSKSPLQILDVISGNDVTIGLAAGIAYCGCFSLDDSLVAIALRSAGIPSIQVWHIGTRQKLVHSRASEHIQDMTFSVDGAILAAADSINHLSVWSTKDGQKLDPNNISRCCRWNPSSLFSTTRSVSFSRELITVRDIATGGTFKYSTSQPDGHSHGFRHVALDRNGKAVAYNDGHRLCVWMIEDQSVHSIMSQWEEHPSDIAVSGSMAISPGGDIIAATLENHTIALWETFSGRWIGTFGQGNVGAMAVDVISFSPDAMQLISMSGHTEIHLCFWDLLTLTTSHYTNSRPETSRSRVNASKIQYVFFSPDGSSCATFAEDQSVTVWNILARSTRTYRHLGNLPGNNIGRAQFSHDGKLIIFKRSYFSDAEDRLDLDTGKIIQISSRHGSQVSLTSSNELYSLPQIEFEYGVDHSGWVVSLAAKRRMIWLPESRRPFDILPLGTPNAAEYSDVLDDNESSEGASPINKNIRFDRSCIASSGSLLAVTSHGVVTLLDLHHLLEHCKQMEQLEREKRREKIMANGANAAITIATKNAKDLISMTRKR